MKQSTKIIIAGLFVILLAVVLIVVFFFLPRNEDNSLIRPKALYALNTDDIESIEVQNEDAHFTFLFQDGGVTLEGYEDRYYDSTETNTVLRLSRQLQAYDTIESNVEDLSIYGLNDPQAKATVTNTEGKKMTVLVGDMMPSNTAYYVMIEGDDTVYGVEEDYLYFYFKDQNTFLSKRITPLYEEDTGYLFENFELTHNGEPMISISTLSEEEEAFYNASGLYKITAPFSAIGDNANIIDYFESVGMLTAARIQKIEFTEDDLAAYNLDNPAYTLSYTYEHVENPEDVTLYFSEIENGFCNVYREGEDTIYSILAARINLHRFDQLGLVNSNQFNRDINLVERVVIDMPDDSYVYGLNRDSGQLVVTLDNEQIDADLFTKLFKIIISSRITDFAEKPEGAEPAVRITVRYNAEDRKNDTIAFYPLNDRLYYMELNDTGSFSVSSVYIDKLIDSIDKLNSGEDFSDTW